jgi:hypothetical protein
VDLNRNTERDKAVWIPMGFGVLGFVLLIAVLFSGTLGGNPAFMAIFWGFLGSLVGIGLAQLMIFLTRNGRIRSLLSISKI